MCFSDLKYCRELGTSQVAQCFVALNVSGRMWEAATGFVGLIPAG